MATSALGIYNNALRDFGEQRLASITEGREPRYTLDDEYPDAVAFALEDGFWTFAMRSAEVYSETGLEPEFGFQDAFAKPVDWVRTYQVSASENFNPPLNDFKDEAGFWYTNQSPIFVKYVSNHATYGMNLALWPQTFVEYVSALLAARICTRITQDKNLTLALEKKMRGLRIDALAKDAMNNGTDPLPSGTWVRARRGGGYARDRVGNSLIG